MKTQLIIKLALTLVLCATAFGTDWEVAWRGACLPGPSLRTEGPFVTFTNSLGGVYSNSCYAQRAIGGFLTVAVHTQTRTVELWFQPPGPEICIDLWAPVCGYEVTVGPLPAGDWLFIIDYTWIPFHIDAPPPDTTLTLLAPKPGQYVLADSTYTVKWTDAPGGGLCAGSYLLSYSSDLGLNWLPVDTNSVDGACSYDWLVPLTAGDEYLLRIQDTGNPGIYHITDQIYIYECNETIPGDLDRDCYVGFRDFSILLMNWSLQPDFQALLTFADQWCACANPYDPACRY